MSAPPESPASASLSGIQRSPSVKSGYSIRMAPSTPDYSMDSNHCNNYYSADPTNSNDGYGMPIVSSQSAAIGDINPDWNGSAIAKMKKQANFTSWTTTCLSYRNCFDRNDPLNKYEKNSPSKNVGA